MKKKKIILISILSVVFILFSITTFLLQGSFSFARAEKTPYSFARIMRDANTANSNFGETPITQIAMLGSHDALSYNINLKSPSNSSEDTISNNWFVKTFAKGAIARYSKAQNHDIYTQLTAGVRYIDARITCINGKYYSSHGLVSHELKDSLIQIIQFLHENPGEFILFHIVHYYPGKSNWNELAEHISSIRYSDKNLYNFINYNTDITNANQLTYNNMTNNGANAGVLILPESRSVNNGFLNYFQINQVSSRWHNKSSTKEIINRIEGEYQYLTTHSVSGLRINQSQTTPTKNGWWDTFIGWSLLKMAKKHNATIIKQSNFDMWLSAMPIYICDYSTSTAGNFNNLVNQKILTYNSNL